MCSVRCTCSFSKATGELIHFPVSHKLQQNTKQGFLGRYGFPGVLGVIDCTPTQNRHLYINRKGTDYVNVQEVCDANNYITNVYANYVGSAHESFILTISQVAAVFQWDDSMRGWLIGVNGYPQKRWLLTPMLNPTTPAEQRYNRTFKCTRTVIEQTFGILKMWFQCLDVTGGTLQ
ncbi:UNVERIFIED_CONTAM: hypothetical protein FKN15_024318 [Acipenser sinensis]